MRGAYTGLVIFAQAEIETQALFSQRDPRMMSGASTIKD
jgi:hypothetical protein